MARSILRSAMLTLALAGASSALAQGPSGPPGHAPPPEAIAACANARSGDACSVNLGGRAMEGVCRAGPDGAPLACAPASMPPPRPPPEAFEACQNRTAGQHCSVNLGGRALEGVCRAGPEGSLACAPEGMPPPR